MAVSAIHPAATRADDGDNVLLGQLNTATNATLVHASGVEVTAFLGRSTATSGIGVEGWAEGTDAAGGRFVANSDTGITFGAIGRTHSPDGIGVYARNLAAGGVGLSVQGKSAFEHSGKATVKAGRSSKTVTLSGVTSSSMVLAVLAQSRSGRYVRAAVPKSGSFTIYLNGNVSKDTKVSWFVLEPFALL